jgi:hypothetical protein
MCWVSRRKRPRSWAHRRCHRRTACSRSSQCSFLRASPRTLRGRRLRRSGRRRGLRCNNRNRRSREPSRDCSRCHRNSRCCSSRSVPSTCCRCLPGCWCSSTSRCYSDLSGTDRSGTGRTPGRARGSSVLRCARIARPRVRRCIGRGAGVGRCRVGHRGPTIRRPGTRMGGRRRARWREHHDHQGEERRRQLHRTMLEPHAADPPRGGGPSRRRTFHEAPPWAGKRSGPEHAVRRTASRAHPSPVEAAVAHALDQDGG